jgi:hypothetical protein
MPFVAYVYMCAPMEIANNFLLCILYNHYAIKG